jgi:AraC family transcriptional regulator, exoenzyme S synthesis regulatory protein ExsA
MVLDHKRIDLFDKMIFEKAVIVPPFRPPNNMPNEACFLYVLNGEQESISPTEKIRIKSKDAVLMKCGLYFTEWIASTEYKQCEAIAVHLYPEVLKKIYEKEIPDFIRDYKKVQNSTTMYKVSGDILIDNYIQSMMFYFENPNLVDDELIKIKLKELILLLVKTEKATSVMAVISGLFSPKEYSFREIIAANIFTNLSLEQLAEFTNLSVSSFKREFAKIYNDSPAHYIKTKKLERAIELLSNADHRISDIAYECGFSDIAHFSKSFQEKYSISPSAYRLNQKGNPLN